MECIAPAPAVSLHLRLSLCTSRWHKQCLTPRKHKYWSASRLRFQPLPDLLRLQQGAQFSPCRAHRLHLHLWWSTSRRHRQCMLYLCLSWCTSRLHKQCLEPPSTGTGLLGASACSLCRTYCDHYIWLRFSPCRAYFYTCTCGGIHRANTNRVRCTCACHEYIAPAQQFLTPCQLKYLSTWRQRLQPTPQLLRL